MEQTLDEVRSELAEIYEELLTLPADDFNRRAELKERQNELRQLSRDLIEGEALYSKDSLRSAYERLHSVRDRLLEQRLSSGSSTSVGDAGIDGAFTIAINKAIDEGLGLDEVEARLQEIIQQMRSSG